MGIRRWLGLGGSTGRVNSIEDTAAPSTTPEVAASVLPGRPNGYTRCMARDLLALSGYQVGGDWGLAPALIPTPVQDPFAGQYLEPILRALHRFHHDTGRRYSGTVYLSPEAAARLVTLSSWPGSTGQMDVRTGEWTYLGCPLAVYPMEGEVVALDVDGGIKAAIPLTPEATAQYGTGWPTTRASATRLVPEC